ncbi:MAG: hypothetical protein QME51_08955 [Planctomycetota bacterium]|nr:hypothetical protein [Planctomycetota bacterium]
MKLVKVRLKDVDEVITKHKSTPMYFTNRGLKSGKEHELRRFNYTFTAEDGTKYYIYSYKMLLVAALKELLCFVRENTYQNDAKYQIEHHSKYPGGILTAEQFKKAKQDYIERTKKDIEFSQQELQRLESL